MIELTSGNLLKAPAEALVNTVNTEGVMGKGIALQFRVAHPAMYEEYVRKCREGELRLGSVHVYRLGELVDGPKYIINFPTKGHWRQKSKIADIVSGLDALVHTVRELKIKSIAVPPLGCGNGGLDWADVRPLIERAFEAIPEVRALVFAPNGAPPAADMVRNTARPNMTVSRAVLVKLIDRYIKGLLDPFVTLLEVQKLMYFMQEAGQPLKLDYTKGTYGPYASNLRFQLGRLEGHYLTGFGDATEQPEKILELLDGAVDKAQDTLTLQDEVNKRMDRVERLIDGFEDSYGMELLSTVHWVMVHNPEARKAPEVAIAEVQRWSSRKNRSMKPTHIRKAWDRLVRDEWHFISASMKD